MKNRFMVLAITSLILSACSSKNNNPSEIREVIKGEVTRTLAARKAKKSGAATTAPAELKRVQLAGITKPIAQIEIANVGVKTLFTVVSESGDYDIYFNKAEQSLTVKNGVLTATRGFGNDLLAADFRNRKKKVYSYINPENHVAKLTVSCEITAQIPERIEIVERSYQTIKTEEVCKSKAASFKNRYWRDEAGKMWRSEQWIGPRIGHAIIDVLN